MPNFACGPMRLRRAIEDDLKAGHLPFAIVACGGATNTGAIDPLDEVADVAAEFGIWLHVDGAFGAWAALDPAYAGRFKALARADSVTLNPHKWLQVPVDCGALLTRHPEVHRAAFSLTPDYLVSGHGEAPWPCEHMFELTFGNRALKVWAAIARLGRSGIAELVTRCNRLATLLEARVRAMPDFELLAPASLSVVNFRYRPADRSLDDAALDALNERISEAVSASGEAHLPTTRVHGRTSLRVCFLHYENDEERRGTSRAAGRVAWGHRSRVRWSARNRRTSSCLGNHSHPGPLKSPLRFCCRHCVRCRRRRTRRRITSSSKARCRRTCR